MEGHEAEKPFARFDDIFALRIAEANHYHGTVRNSPMTPDERRVVRQADAGLVWARKFYHYIVEHWLEGDPSQPPPPSLASAGATEAGTTCGTRCHLDA